MKKIVFRVDSGNHIGMGHVMRCLTLAHEFKILGWAIFFITKDHLGFFEELISNQYPIFILNGGLKEELPLELKNHYQSWLGENWESDLEKTNQILAKLRMVDLVVLDHYAIDEKYERLLLCNKVLVIDDLMTRDHYCDYLLNQNSSSDRDIYKCLTSEKKSHLFLGPTFSLLRREFSVFRELSEKKRKHDFRIKNILVFFGGGDICNDCIRLAHSLSEKELTQYNFTFILSKSHETFIELSNWASQHQEILKIIPFVENMAKVMTEHDFFIGAGGATSWERVCLGIPSAIVSVADNQIKISESLSELGLVYYLGEDHNVDTSLWRDFFEKKIIQYEMFQEMSRRCFNFIDGNGACRVATEIAGDLK